MQIVFDLVPKGSLTERSFHNFIQDLLVLNPCTFMGKSDVAVDRLGKGIWSLEDHSDMFTHLINIDFWTVNINSLIEDLTCDLSNINGIIHAIETAKVG